MQKGFLILLLSFLFWAEPLATFAQDSIETENVEAIKFYLFGKILTKPNTNYPAKNALVVLKDSDNKTQGRTFTDGFGNFFFPNIKEFANYTIELNAGFLNTQADSLYLANQSGYILDKSAVNEFIFNFNVSFYKLLGFVGYSKFYFKPNFEGYLLDNEKAPIKSTKVFKLDENNEIVLFGKKTNYLGYVSFSGNNAYNKLGIKHLPRRKDNIKPNSKIYFVNKYKVIIDSTTTNLKGEFSFQNLPKFTYLDGLLPVASQTLLYRDRFSESFYKVSTDYNGIFTMDSLNPNLEYIVSISANRSRVGGNSFIYLTDLDGNYVQAARTNDQGVASFIISGENKVTYRLNRERTPEYFTVNLEGRLFPIGVNVSGLPNVTVNIYDGNGKFFQRTTTNSNGFFRLTNLTPIDHYLVEVLLDDKDLRGVVLVNSDRQIVKYLQRQGEAFVFEFLPSDHRAAGNAVMDIYNY